jgi:hypothetical protein
MTRQSQIHRSLDVSRRHPEEARCRQGKYTLFAARAAAGPDDSVLIEGPVTYELDAEGRIVPMWR